ncbi:MAG: 4-hydroxy-tetrahydrodipicolinate reductase [Methanomassiliicoccaceae archaeon]|jgi:4-hydroxy-tetrahydrodipicolinate reductase|nr:4-hydroxy-tetrahydrodipicolinate reductase [Methanomassiliicoccaceae archaeon]
MINVALGGATGKMGRTVCDIIQKSKDMRLVGAMIAPEEELFGKEVYPGVIAKGIDELKSVVENADVYVDITAAGPASKVITKVPSMGVNMVIGTTGISENVIQNMRDEVSKNKTSAVLSANYAVGVNVFWKMCEILASSLKDYDIEVIEAHHNQKKDAPSGTAMEAVKRMMKVTEINDVVYGREGMPGARKKEIGVHAVRGGDIVGDHTVIFAGSGEVIELKHRMGSRDALAKGFIESIRWIYGKKDGKVHDLNGVLGL